MTTTSSRETPGAFPTLEMDMESNLQEMKGVRVAVQGCGHGTLDEIYATIKTSCRERNWSGVDLVIIGGDFQAVRNAADLTVMSCPPKYRQLGGFHRYYSGAKKAPWLTIFAAGNHEAASHLRELPYGGWVAPNIYYLGWSNVVRYGPLRIAALGGIWGGDRDYHQPHHERVPFTYRDIKSFYHVREIEVRKLLQIKTQVDVCLSHDWPRFIERWGNERFLFRKKPAFEKESLRGDLGNPAATLVMDRLRPPYWFASHMHIKFAAIRQYVDGEVSGDIDPRSGLGRNARPKEMINAALQRVAESRAAWSPESRPVQKRVAGAAKVGDQSLQTAENPDEIDLDLDVVGDAVVGATTEPATTPAATAGLTDANPDEMNLDVDGDVTVAAQPATAAITQLPKSFFRKHKLYEDSESYSLSFKLPPGQPPPPGITNKTVRFLALSKCLPGHKFLQLLTIPGVDDNGRNNTEEVPDGYPFPYKLSYDPEWLAIVRVFHPSSLTTAPPADRGEEHYAPLLEESRAWVDRHVVTSPSQGQDQDKQDTQDGLAIPLPDDVFVVTAPPHVPGDPTTVTYQPCEYTNPQTSRYCNMLGLKDLWHASEAERSHRKTLEANISLGPAWGGRGDRGGRGGRGDRGGRGGRGGQGSQRGQKSQRGYVAQRY